MILHRLCCLIGVVSLTPLISIAANGSLTGVDPAASRVSPNGDVKLIGTQDANHLRFDVQSESPGAQVLITFKRPLSLVGGGP